MNETFYSENDFRLYHHGVIRMAWGVRNGPPYPLDSGVSGAVKSGNNPAGTIKELKRASSRSGANRAEMGRISNKITDLVNKGAPEKEIKKAVQQGTGILDRLKSSSQRRKEAAAKAKEEEEAAKKRIADELAKKQAEEEARQAKEASDRAKKEKEDLINSGDAEAVYNAAKSGRLSNKELQEAVNRVNLMKQLEGAKPEPETINKWQKAADKIKDITTFTKNGVELYNEVATIVNSISPDFQLFKLDGNALNRARDTRNRELEEIIRTRDDKKISSVAKELSYNQLKEVNQWNDENKKLSKRIADSEPKPDNGGNKQSEPKPKQEKKEEEPKVVNNNTVITIYKNKSKKHSKKRR